jgi:peptidoglycan/LPS O-acetylase OafA/YrhL
MASFLKGSEIVPALIAVVAGVLGWDLVRLLGNHGEAWDDPTYWRIGFPILLFTAFILAMGFPERPWRWVIIIIGAQAIWSFLIALATSGVPNLFPLGLLVFALLALPCLAAAYAGQWVGTRVRG